MCHRLQSSFYFCFFFQTNQQSDFRMSEGASKSYEFFTSIVLFTKLQICLHGFTAAGRIRQIHLVSLRAAALSLLSIWGTKNQHCFMERKLKNEQFYAENYFRLRHQITANFPQNDLICRGTIHCNVRDCVWSIQICINPFRRLVLGGKRRRAEIYLTGC